MQEMHVAKFRWNSVYTFFMMQQNLFESKLNLSYFEHSYTLQLVSDVASQLYCNISQLSLRFLIF